MTTHQLADLLDSLRTGLAAGLTKPAAGAFQDAAAAFRELPDQTLKALVGQIRAKPPSPPRRGSYSRAKPVVDIERVIADIRRAQQDGRQDANISIEIRSLTGKDLEHVLKQFSVKVPRKVDDRIERVRSLLSAGTAAPAGPTRPPPTDPELVELGFRTYARLRDDRTLSVADVRAEFQTVRNLPKPVIEEVLRRIGFTPDGSREDMANRLLSNLESIKMGQMHEELILNGK